MSTATIAARSTVPLFRVFMAPEASAAVAGVLAPRDDGSIYVGEGERCAELEQGLRLLLNAPTRPLLVNSGTSALHLALHLAGVGPGDEVVTTPMTCSATNSPIVLLGARPVWADVDPVTGLINPRDVARKITPRTRAIMAVDWAGRLCDYAALRAFGLPVIQDAAHSLTAGLGGDYIAYSFQAIKHLTVGDGGALIVPERDHQRARLLRWFGLDRESRADFRCAQDIAEPGYKFQSTDIAAAIGLANLPHARWIVQQHRANARYYGAALASCRRVTLPPADPTSAWWLYTVLTDDRDGFIAHMAERGIAASQVHRRNDEHSGFRFPNGPLPGVDAFSARQAAIPVGWWLTSEDRERIVDAVLTWDARG